jgi:hypothetical protein
LYFKHACLILCSKEQFMSKEANALSAILALIAEDHEVISYRPALARMTGSVFSAILLQQVFFRYKSKGWEPFYKFNAPCDHELCRAGDSWIEELVFSRHLFEDARAVIGTKRSKAVSKESVLSVQRAVFDETGKMTNANKLVVYWYDQRKLTWYELNRALFDDALHCIYSGEWKNRIPNNDGNGGESEPHPDAQNATTLHCENATTSQSKNVTEQHSLYTENTYREYTENTTAQDAQKNTVNAALCEDDAGNIARARVDVIGGASPDFAHTRKRESTAGAAIDEVATEADAEAYLRTNFPEMSDGAVVTAVQHWKRSRQRQPAAVTRQRTPKRSRSGFSSLGAVLPRALAPSEGASKAQHKEIYAEPTDRKKPG